MHFHLLHPGEALPPLPSEGNFTLAGRDRLLVLKAWPQVTTYTNPQPYYDIYTWRDDLAGWSGWKPVMDSGKAPIVAWAFLWPDKILEEMQSFRLTLEEVAYGKGVSAASSAVPCPDLPQQVGKVGPEGDRPADGQGSPENEELRPCPFCGGPAMMLVQMAQCSDGYCRGNDFSGFAKDWNKRPIEDRLREELENNRRDAVDGWATARALSAALKKREREIEDLKAGNRYLERGHAEAMALVLSHEGVIERLRKDLADRDSSMAQLVAREYGHSMQDVLHKRTIEQLQQQLQWALGYGKDEEVEVERLQSEVTSLAQAREGWKSECLDALGRVVRMEQELENEREKRMELLESGGLRCWALGFEECEKRVVERLRERILGSPHARNLLTDLAREIEEGIHRLDNPQPSGEEPPQWAVDLARANAKKIVAEIYGSEKGMPIGMDPKNKCFVYAEPDHEETEPMRDHDGGVQFVPVAGEDALDEEEIFFEEVGRVAAEEDPGDFEWARHAVCGLIRWSLNFRESDDSIHFYIRKDLSSLLSNVEQAAKRAGKGG